MNYPGTIATIPLGQGGIFTDEPHPRIPGNKLVRAINATLYNGVAEKDYGSRQWNSTAMGTGVIEFCDWWPDANTQRMLALGRDGKVYRFTGPFNAPSEVTPAGTEPAALSVTDHLMFVQAGNEVIANSKKLFVFTGESPVQVITGDGVTRATIAHPAADWASNQHPIGGVVHRNRLFAFLGHTVYASLATDHENFTSTPLTFSVYPGDGQRIIGGFVFKRRLFIVKYPKGVYFLVDDDADPDNWYFAKFNDSFGGVGPRAGTSSQDDYWLANSSGSITSLSASQQYADFQSSSMFNLLRVKRFFSEEISAQSTPDRSALYYEHKQQVFFSFRSRQSNEGDRLVVISLSNPKSPEVTLTTKDQVNCLGLIRDNVGVDRPAYGSDDGFIYLMDQEDRWVGPANAVGEGYRFEILTPHIDFSEMGEMVSEQVKNFEFLELVYEPTGEFKCFVDVFIDGKFIKTIEFVLSGRSQLDQMQLDEVRLDDGCPFQDKKTLGGSGRRIALRCYNETAGENVKLIKFRVFFKIVGQDQKPKGE